MVSEVGVVVGMCTAYVAVVRRVSALVDWSSDYRNDDQVGALVRM